MFIVIFGFTSIHNKYHNKCVDLLSNNITYTCNCELIIGVTFSILYVCFIDYASFLVEWIVFRIYWL